MAGGWQTAVSVGRLHIVAIATLGTFTFGWLFTGKYLWALAVVCAIDWFIVNLLNRVVDLPEDQRNAITGTGFVARHRRAILVTGFGLLATTLVAGSFVWPQVTPLRIAYHCLGLAYNWRLLPGGRRIKEAYFWKNAASATGFLLTVFGYPLAAADWDVHAFAPGITWSTIGLTALFFFLFELSYEAIYDLRDVEGDAAEKVRTYAVVHGVPTTTRIIDALLVSSMLVLAAGFATGTVPWRIFVMIAAPALQLGLYKRVVVRGVSSSDCIRLTWLGAGLLAAYHVWIVLGLPGVTA